MFRNCRLNGLLNPRCNRALGRPASSHVSAILDSPRYSQHRRNLYHVVSRPSFTAYWVIQSSLTKVRPPRTSDIILYYLHGGGYFASHPGIYLLFLLRLAESLLDRGLSVSILALDYRLAPEDPFPAQLQDATAAYSYLLGEMQVPAKNLIVAGDSAGGHLALSFLLNLQKPYPGLCTEARLLTLLKPEGVVLMSPWLSLHHAPSTFTTNLHTDVLTPAFLRTTARRFLGSGTASEHTHSPYLEFLSPDPATDWDVVLPAWVWVSAGQNEILFGDVDMWVTGLISKLGTTRLEWEVGTRKPHVWQWLETMDEGKKKNFLVECGKEFQAIERLGNAIGERFTTADRSN
jgi:acetyl esterase/lipase